MEGSRPIVDSPSVASPPTPADRLATLWQDFLSALSEVTLLRRAPEGTVQRIGRSALFYPAIGLAIGAALWLLDEGLRAVTSQEVTSVLLVAALVVVTGGRPLDGFANTADGLIGFRGRQWALATMRDRRLGTFGSAAIFFVLILKVRAFDLLADEPRTLALLLAPMLGRWAAVVLIHGSRDAAPSDVSDRFSPAVGFGEFAIASVATFLAVLAVGEAFGLLVLVLVAAATVGLRLYFHRRLGGVVEPAVGATAEAAETIALLVFAFLS